MKGFIVVAISVLIVTLSLCATSVEADFVIKDIQYWYSNLSVIGFDVTRRIYRENIDGNFAFNTHVTYARNQWSSAGITSTLTSTKSRATIEIYGGLYNTLWQRENRLGPADSGLTVYANWQFMGFYNYYGQMKEGRLLTKTRIYVVDKGSSHPYTQTYYRSVFTHELGHSLGWYGHSSNAYDVMYAVYSGNTQLTHRDINHLVQVYD